MSKSKYTVPELVRLETARKGLTQADLAIALGVHQTYISRRMRGHVSWSVDDLLVIARTLGVDPAVFLADVRAAS